MPVAVCQIKIKIQYFILFPTSLQTMIDAEFDLSPNTIRQIITTEETDDKLNFNNIVNESSDVI